MKTKICNVCGLEKPLEEFVKQKRNKDGRDNICKKCNVKRFKKWKENNRKSFLAYQRKYNEGRKEKKKQEAAKKRKEIRLFLHEYKKDKSCEICGYNKVPDILVFHHVDQGQKSFKIAERNSSTVEILKEEIEKCILVCPNCHRKLHWNGRKKKKSYAQSLKKECSICGENRYYMLDFHHLYGKDFSIHSISSKAIIEEEVKKCIVVCANCHAEIHWRQNSIKK